MVGDQNFHKVKRYITLVFIFFVSSSISLADNLSFKKIVKLDDPWGSTFINEKELLITEKSGKIKLINIETKKNFSINS